MPLLLGGGTTQYIYIYIYIYMGGVTVDGSEILRSPVEGTVVNIPVFTTGFKNIPGDEGFLPSIVVHI